MELRRHTDNDGDALTPDGVAAAEAIGRDRLRPPYAAFVSTGAARRDPGWHDDALSRRDRGRCVEVRMEFTKLIPQILFDILARFVPGAVLLCSWITFLGHDDWRRLLDALLGGNLDDGNALPAAMLALLFLSFLLGYLLAPFTGGVQRLSEAPPLVTKRRQVRWLAKDADADPRYDWLRAHHPGAGALCAKIRAEFTMYYALSVAFLAAAIMASLSGAIAWAVASLLAVPLTAWRGAKTEEIFQETTGKFYSAYAETKAPADEGRSTT